MAKLFIFDLDGTLANTSELTSGRRTPYDVLSLVPPGGNTSRISFGQDVWNCQQTMEGAGVFIITRSPMAYASTLTGLLDIDYHLGFASIQNGYGSGADAHKLALKDTIYQLDPSYLIDNPMWEFDGGYGSPYNVELIDMVYIADTDIDQQAAKEIGIPYYHADWNNGLAEELLAIVDNERNAYIFDSSEHNTEVVITQGPEPQWNGIIRREKPWNPRPLPKMGQNLSFPRPRSRDYRRITMMAVLGIKTTLVASRLEIVAVGHQIERGSPELEKSEADSLTRAVF